MDKGGKLTIFSYRFGGKKVVKMFKELLDTGKVHINLVLNNTMSRNDTLPYFHQINQNLYNYKNQISSDLYHY